MGEEFKMSCHLTSRAPDPLSHRLNLAQVGGIEGKDSIRFSQLCFFDYYSLSLIISRFRHGIGMLKLLPSLNGSGEGNIVGVF